MASLGADRLTALDPEAGIEAPEELTGPVSSEEAEQRGLPSGTAMPAIMHRTLSRARSAPVERLIAEGVVPSAEVLAQLVPGISATVVASGYADEALARLAAANYRAFRRRRSLLLLHLEKQVQLDELPWVRAMARHRRSATDEATAVVRRVGALALDEFPATILPNPLVRELQHLVAAAGLDVPLVEELAADIFMGRFSDKFRRAAQDAVRVMGGTLYTRYYRIDPDEVRALRRSGATAAAPVWSRWRKRRTPTGSGPTFGQLCHDRAGHASANPWSVAANGAVIEQSQVLTTHNLAALVALGVQPTRPWIQLARTALTHTAALLQLATQQRKPLASVKDAAYAWRQAVFFLRLAPPAEVEALLAEPWHAPDAATVMPELLEGLRRAAGGAPVGDHDPFVGWSVGRHWVLDALGRRADAES